MDKKNRRERKQELPPQEWNPHWSVKLLYSVWMVLFSAFKIALGALATVLLIVLVCGFVFVGILGDYLQDEVLLESQNYELNITDLDQTSFVYGLDANGNIVLLQRLYTSVDRQWATLDEIPDNLVNATIAIEDKRFYEHQGVDWITTVKACINMFMGGDSQFGGSTITQQLIKNDTGEDSVTVQRKVMEIFRAQHAEQMYDKDTIMEWYLNTIYLGRGCYGVKSAAEEYFGKELQMLTPAECASLISITNNPSLFNPFGSTLTYEGRVTTGQERNRDRQLKVLNQMREQKMLTEEEYRAAVDQELVFKSGIDPQDRWCICENESCGFQSTVSAFTTENGHYCPECGTHKDVEKDASQEVYSYFVDTVIEDVAADLAARDGVNWDSLNTEERKLYKARVSMGGYNIYTTIDPDVQAQVDKIYTDLSQIPTTRSAQQLQSAIVIIDNSTGDIVAMAGGVGEKTVHDGYNRATEAELQTGSSQKPLSVYAPAFEAGVISPATVIKDLPISYAGGHFPKNDNRKYDYSRTVFSGVRYSVNAIAVHTLDKVGVEYAFKFAKENLGLSTLVEKYTTASGRELTDLGYAPLGMGALTVGATVRDMTAAYATFANKGVYREARTYTKVYNSTGELVLDNTQESHVAMSEKTVNYMNYCLYYAANSGTGGSAVFKGQNVYGKTGTTANSRDRWFCGFTAHYTAAVWVGYDNPEQVKVSGNPAAKLFKKVMQPIHQGLPKKSLYSTSKFRTVTVCLDSGMLATDACRSDVRGNRTTQAYCYREDAPKGYCTKHTSVNYCYTGGGVATDYCHHFASVDPTIKIGKGSLVMLTPNEVKEIQKATGKGLGGMYFSDGYVLYTNKNGEPQPWHGFKGNANKDSNEPYLVCPVHTQAAWEAYQEQKRQEEQERLEQEQQQQQQQQQPQPQPDPTPPAA